MIRVIAVGIVALLAVCDVARAEVRLAAVISHDAVLQRDARVPIWGRADPGEAVVVAFAGQTRETKADRFGRWHVQLDPLPASAEGRQLTVRGPAGAIDIDNVVVGDVFLYLVMAFHLKENSPYRAGEPGASELPPIRFFRASEIFEFRTHSRRPRDEFESSGTRRWSVYRPPGKYFAHEAFYLGLGLGRETGVPVGVMGLGASTLESMTPPEGFKHYPLELAEAAREVATWTPRSPEGRQAYLKTLGQVGDWVAATRATLNRGDATFEDLAQPPLLPGPPAYERGPTTHYNDVIHRVMPAAMRGVIIETHESNVGDPHFAAKAAALIKGLREVAKRPELPVCFVQMNTPHQYERNAAQDQNDWVTLREAQARLMQDDPTVTVVATYDIGPKDRDAIPTDRALRAAQWAAALVHDAPPKTGPVYRRHRIEGAKIVVEFDNVGAGLMAGVKEAARPVRPAATNDVGGFQIAGADNQWHDAAAAIEGDTVVVRCDNVANPAAVRYAWAPEPTAANLYNRAGFPALPHAK